jgi:Flp pilus assembly protein TadG
MSARERLRVDPERKESGVLTAFVAVFALVIFVVAGTVFDTGRAIAEQRIVDEEAAQAARVGAGQLSVQALRSGQVVLDDSQAIKAAEAFTDLSGHPGTATVRGQVVTVRIVVAVPTTILGIVGVKSIRVSADASASDVRGVTRND